MSVATSISLDAPALRTIVELTTKHAAEWVNVRGDTNSLVCELYSSLVLDETGKPIAVYHVQYAGDAQLIESHVPATRGEIIRMIQSYCADVAERDAGRHPYTKQQWTRDDGVHVALLLMLDAEPMSLFRYIDEQTGASDVGYRTPDGREWFHVLRQMRNQPGSGLFETLKGDA